MKKISQNIKRGIANVILVNVSLHHQLKTQPKTKQYTK